MNMFICEYMIALSSKQQEWGDLMVGNESEGNELSFNILKPSGVV